MLQRLIKNGALYPKLQVKYRLLTSAMVLVGGAAAFPIWMKLASWSRLALGLPLGEGTLDGIRLQFLVWILVILAGIVVVLYAGVLLASTATMLVLVLSGAVSSREAFEYVVYSEFPDRWFQAAA